MMSLESMLIDYTPYWITIIILFTAFLVYYKLRINWKKEQLKGIKKENKDKESFDGAISALLNDAPKNLKTIESEIETLKAKGATPEMLKRLESERDMLNLAVRYGDLAKPLIKPLGSFLNRIVGGLTKNG